MKNVLYVILALSLVTVSCKSRKEAKEKAKQEALVNKENEVAVPENTVEEMPSQKGLELEDKEEGIALITISKSVCFGVCPAYTAKVFKDGTVLYEGRKNVKHIGNFKGKIDLKLIESTIDEITNVGYFQLEKIYDNKNVTDMPTTITYVNNNGKAKKVICRFECDPRLEKVNILIETLIETAVLTQVD